MFQENSFSPDLADIIENMEQYTSPQELIVYLLEINRNCMKCVLTVAGLGTRLLPLTKDMPKSLVSIFGKPILEYQLNRINKHLRRVNFVHNSFF
jgi:hypothetical protein